MPRPGLLSWNGIVLEYHRHMVQDEKEEMEIHCSLFMSDDRILCYSTEAIFGFQPRNKATLVRE
jgi:hypothetical protein